MKGFWNMLMKLFGIEHQHDSKGEEMFVPSPEDATFGQLKIQIHGMKDFTEAEKKKFLSAVHYGAQVLNSLEFKERVCSSTFAENRQMSGTQIWELICTGKDLYNESSDSDIDVFVTMYHNFWTGTVGYTFPNTFKTWINRQFFSSFDESGIFGNVLHEAMHNFGFDHIDADTIYETVPYKVGYIGRDLVKEVMSGKQLTPLKVGI